MFDFSVIGERGEVKELVIKFDVDLLFLCIDFGISGLLIDELFKFEFSLFSGV